MASLKIKLQQAQLVYYSSISSDLKYSGEYFHLDEQITANFLFTKQNHIEFWILSIRICWMSSSGVQILAVPLSFSIVGLLFCLYPTQQISTEWFHYSSVFPSWILQKQKSYWIHTYVDECCHRECKFKLFHSHFLLLDCCFDIGIIPVSRPLWHRLKSSSLLSQYILY